MNKHYEVQPNQAQRTTLKCDSLMAQAMDRATQGATLTITRNGAGILASIEDGSVSAWAQLTQRGTITASYSNQWGK